MIETTYIRLEQAAAMLSTDADTMLIAAAEGRIRAFWLLNATVRAECGRFEETGGGPDDPPEEWVRCDAGIRHFTFIPLAWDEAAELLISTEIVAWARWLSKPDDERNQWTPFGGAAVAENWLQESKRRVTRDYVYFERADIEAIKAAHATPAPGTIKNAPLPRPVPRDGKLIETLAALLAAWPGGAIPSGKDLEKAAQSLGLTLSDDTIRKALKAAQEAAPSLPLPK